MFCQNKSHLKSYLFEFGGSMLAYLIVIFTVAATRPHEGISQYLELLPSIPLLLGLWAIIRHYRRMDEFHQKVNSEAFALAALIMGVGIMIWGFAENAGFPKLSTIFIAPALLALWGICTPIVISRYK